MWTDSFKRFLEKETCHLSCYSVCCQGCHFFYCSDTFFPGAALKIYLIDSNPNAAQLSKLNFTFHLSSWLDPEEQAGAPSTYLTEELRRLRAEDQVKQLQLEESHRQEVEHLRAHYQQQAAETEERYLTELFMLQQRLQEVTGTQTHFRWSPQFPHMEHIFMYLDLGKVNIQQTVLTWIMIKSFVFIEQMWNTGNSYGEV